MSKTYFMTFENLRYMADLMETEYDAAVQDPERYGSTDFARLESTCDTLMDQFRTGLAQSLDAEDDADVELTEEQRDTLADSLLWRYDVAFDMYAKDDPYYDEERQNLRECFNRLKLAHLLRESA
jgi:hypothetical protein